MKNQYKGSRKIQIRLALFPDDRFNCYNLIPQLV